MAADNPVGEMVKSFKKDFSMKNDPANLPPSKDAAMSDATSCISSGDAVGSAKEVDTDQDPSVVEQPMYYPVNNYYGYYYPGCEMPYTEWSDNGYLLGADGTGMSQPVIQSDAGSFVYYIPGYQPGYNSYTNYMPGSFTGADGQYVAHQQTYPTSPVTPQSPVYFPPSMGYGPEMMPAYGWDSTVWDLNNGNSYVGNYPLPSSKPKYSANLQTSKSALNSKGIAPETKKTTILEFPPKVEIPDQSLKNFTKTSVPTKGYFPIAKLPSCTYQGKGGYLYPNHPVHLKDHGRGWAGTEKIKARNKVNGFTDSDLLNEQNRGPRTNTSKNTSISGSDHALAPVTELEINSGTKTTVINRDDYNLSDFPTNYEHASFFVIKSYSEDDIHKSIKYNVWSSTPNGNKRLDLAYQTAQDKKLEKGSKCPVFLFFSVNASGQFCGVAEMISRVDFSKNMEFWQQDKWNGCFQVKWHIIKDVPNPQFRHIILENNDNKPVTNSRDTQEVRFPQGSEMLKIFKTAFSKTSILDDFGFYENRQKVMQDKRTKMIAKPVENFLPKVEEAAKLQESDNVNSLICGVDAIDLGSEELVKDEKLIACVK